MNSKITMDPVKNGKWKLSLQNVVDELVEFPAVPKQIKKVEIDLGDLSYMNSSGIRNWVEFIEKLVSHKPPVKVELTRLTLSMIRAAETIREILPKSFTVLSFYVDSVCTSCNYARKDLVQNSMQIQLPTSTCPTCKTELTKELFEKSYLQLAIKAPGKS